MRFADLSNEQLFAILHGKHPALVHDGSDWIVRELAAVGLQEDDEAAENLIRKMAKTGCGLCKARTRKGTRCRALGDGAGGRCKNHGGESTGPTTPSGKARAMAALALARIKRWDRRGPDAAADDADECGQFPAPTRIDMGCCRSNLSTTRPDDHGKATDDDEA